jgi:Na+/H+-dicarboxylate symporter
MHAMGTKQLIGMVIGALVGLLVGYVGRCTGGSA